MQFADIEHEPGAAHGLDVLNFRLDVRVISSRTQGPADSDNTDTAVFVGLDRQLCAQQVLALWYVTTEGCYLRSHRGTSLAGTLLKRVGSRQIIRDNPYFRSIRRRAAAHHKNQPPRIV